MIFTIGYFDIFSKVYIVQFYFKQSMKKGMQQYLHTVQYHDV